MLTSQWLDALRHQHRSRFQCSTRARRNRSSAYPIPAARTRVSRNSVETLEDRTLLTTFTVLNTDDSGAGSLRDAIEQANATSGADTIVFDVALATQTIVVSTEMEITDDLTITGLGSDQLTLDGNGDGRIFRVSDGSYDTLITVSLSGMTMTNAYSSGSGGAVINLDVLTIDDCTFTGNETNIHGGGVYSTRGTLTVTNSEFSGNVAAYGGGLGSVDGTMSVSHSTFHQNEVNTYGGGIFYNFDNQVETTPLEVTDSTFTENVAGSGGGICVSSATLHLSNSSLSMNEAPSGAGVFALFAEASITGTTFSSNNGLYRGAIYNYLSDMTVADSTFFQNQATNDVSSSASGGAIASVDGTLTVTDSMFEENSVKTSGGAIYHSAGTSLSVSGSTFLKNTAINTGGAIYNSNSTLTVVESNFTENEATESRGGGIYHSVNTLLEDEMGASISRSTFTKNSTTSSGGGLYVTNGVVTIQESTFSENTAQQSGGGVYNSASEVTVENSTFSKNTAGSSGGGLFNYDTLLLSGSTFDENSAQFGGALYSSESATVVNSTLSQNRAESSGGGIYAVGAIPLTVINSTIVLNSVTGVGSGGGIYSPYIVPTVSNTIVAGNTASGIQQISGTYTSNSSIVQDSIEGLVSADLEFNGGLTRTHVLLPDSAAIDTGDNSIATTAGLVHDQRGEPYARIYNGNVDIGAFEIEGDTLLVSSTADVIDGDYSYGNLTLREAIQLANANSEIERIRFDATLLSGQTIVVSTEIEITDDLTIAGLGSDQLTLDGNGDSRIFRIDDSNSATLITVSLTGITLTNGYSSTYGGAIYNSEALTIEDCTVTANNGRTGGGIYSRQGTLAVINSEFSGNIGSEGGGLYMLDNTLTVSHSTFHQNEVSHSGGGIYYRFDDMEHIPVEVTDSTFTENVANAGGGIYLWTGTLQLSDSTLSLNEANSGGGIYSRLAETFITESTFSSNLSSAGGAVYVHDSDLTVTDSTFFQNQATSDSSVASGGAISNSGGTLTVTNSTFEQNSAKTNAGAIFHSSGTAMNVSGSTFLKNMALSSGGAIYNINSMLNVSESMFMENEALGNRGGAIYQSVNPSLEDEVGATIIRSSFTKNISAGEGGGINLEGGALLIQESSFTENSAQLNGGGVNNLRGEVTVENSTFTENSAVNSGGAVFNYDTLLVTGSTFAENSARYGGSFYNSGSATVVNSTLSQNRAENSGGGIYAVGSIPLTLINSTVVLNSITGTGNGGGIASENLVPTISNSIVAGNTANGAKQIAGTFTSNSSIVQDSIEGLVSADLEFNGGLTQTHALLPDSAAIDAGDNSIATTAGLVHDQRGEPYARFYDGTVDAGAYEFEGVTLLVSSAADEIDGDYSYGNLTLREAIQLANATPEAEKIRFDATLLSGQTIVFSNEIQITDDLTIIGLGADLLTLDGNGDSRIFTIDNGNVGIKINVEISGLTLANGSADFGGAIHNNREALTILDSTLSGNTASSSGGAIYNYYADLSIENSKLLGNTTGEEETTGYGGGIYQLHGSLTIGTTEFTDNAAVSQGGGIHMYLTSGATITNSTFTSNESLVGGAVFSSSATLTIDNSDFTENYTSSDSSGGAIHLNGGNTQVSNSTFTENVSLGGGGAIQSFTGSLDVLASTFIENRSQSLGGAIRISSADVTVQESTFTGNQSGSGGAIGMQGQVTFEMNSSTLNQNSARGNGGAIFNNSAISLTIENSTLSENIAAHSGGGLYTFANSHVSVINSTIVKNEATHFSGGGINREFPSGSFILSNSIVAGNTSNQISGSYTQSNNIIQSSLDGLLDPVLRDNGGPTLTHALVSGSAAIDAGSNSAAQSAGLTKDQRGGIHHRIFNGTVDIGAYESYSGLLQVDSLSDVVDGNYATGELSLREAIEIANLTPEVDLITFHSTLSGQTILLNSELVISSSLNISGLGAELLTISGNNNSRIFNIDDTDTEVASVVNISQLNLINGTADQGGAIYNTETLTLTDAILNQNTAQVSGGGIYNNAGDLLLDQVQFLDNSAGEIESPGYGAGLYQNDGTLSVIGSLFSGNHSTGSGGGIYSSAADVFLISDSTFDMNSSRTGGAISKTFGSLIITESTFTGNDAFEGQGGAIFSGVSANELELIQIEESLFSGNTSQFEGGAIYSLGGTLTIKDSTFSENAAALSGGALHSLGNGAVTIETTTFDGNHSDKDGGAIGLVGVVSLDLFASTLSNNSSDGRGGAIFNNAIGGSGIVRNSTLSGNTSAGLGSAIYTPAFGAFSVINSTIVGNRLTSENGLGAIAVDPDFSTYSLFTIDNSIVAGNDGSQISGSYAGANNVVQASLAGLIDPVLRDNGGPTQTHALLLGSAAIDAGNNTKANGAGLVDDQRGSGFTRTVGGTVDIGAYELQVDGAQLDLRIVESATSTSASGEAAALPEDLEWLSEWQEYWVEIWITTTDLSNLGLLSVSLDLAYNSAVTTATGIEYGAAFTQNQTGTINDLTGMIESLSAETALTDVGADQHVLFARIHFESTADDAVDLDLEGQSLNPQSPELVMSQAEIQLAGGLDSDELYNVPPAAEIWANPYDYNDDNAINFRDLIVFASVYGLTPSAADSDYAWVADLDQNDHVNFRDLIAFAANYGKSKADQTAVSYPDGYPDAWDQLLVVDSQSPVVADAPVVTQSIAESAFDAISEQVTPGLSDEQIETLTVVEIEVVDLSGNKLGRAVGSTIYIDVNAAGRGWFVDSTPAEHSEFNFTSELTLVAPEESEAADGVDLWTVILHELGHVLGHEHEETGLMQETLAPGERFLPDWDVEIDLFFGSVSEDAELLSF